MDTVLTNEEGNKIIAEFMGAEWVQDDYGDWGYKSTLFPSHYKYWAASALKYHSDWSWLMPVVEKIETLPCQESFCFWILSNSISISVLVHPGMSVRKPIKELPELHIKHPKDKLKTLWLAAVQFIQWYNSQKP